MARTNETGPSPRVPPGPCVPAADLTAFAHGELPEWHRAEISRHLLRCSACRRHAEGARSVFARLSAFGAAGEGWRDDVAAARAAHAAATRTSWRAVVAGAAAAAALLLGFTALYGGWGAPASRAHDLVAPAVVASVATRSPLSRDEEALLAAQKPDGRWSAGPALRDEAATGLALLALATRRPRELREGAVGRAAAAATSWLLARERSDGSIGRSAGDAPARDQAVAAAALLEVYAATGEASLRPPIDRALRDLERRARGPREEDDAGSRWTSLALSRARSLGWDRVDDGALVGDGAAPREGSTAAPTSLAAVLGPAAGGEGLGDDAGSPVERAIRVLRHAPRT